MVTFHLPSTWGVSKLQATGHICPATRLFKPSFIGAQSCLFAYLLSMTAFILQWQGWIDMTETTWPKRYTTSTLYRKSLTIPALHHNHNALILNSNPVTPRKMELLENLANLTHESQLLHLLFLDLMCNPARCSFCQAPSFCLFTWQTSTHSALLTLNPSQCLKN